jgi:hypothetical protein
VIQLSKSLSSVTYKFPIRKEPLEILVPQDESKGTQKLEIGNGYHDYFRTATDEIEVRSCKILDIKENGDCNLEHTVDNSELPGNEHTNATLAEHVSISTVNPFKMSFL